MGDNPQSILYFPSYNTVMVHGYRCALYDQQKFEQFFIVFINVLPQPFFSPHPSYIAHTSSSITQDH